MKQKGSDYKISAVKYHLSHKASLNKTCKNEDKNITWKNTKYISYKIRNEQVKSALDKIDKKE